VTAFIRPGGPLRFPAASSADEDGLVAVGGDLTPDRLLLAYDCGLFPWYDVGLPPLWWSPDPRTVVLPETLHVSRRLARTLRGGAFAFSWDRAFAEVMRGCAEERDGGTWILPEMRSAYGELHRLGHAHSVEVWDGDALVGGLYGVHRGGLFAAESMFHRATDASKAALVAGARSLFRAGIEVIDVQMTTPHLVRMGAVEWPRAKYLRRVAELRKKPVALVGLDVRA
jgi:leucyl/phenylalanyl-tRNA--protein transferase